MTVARITEISSVSSKSFEDAISQGVKRANKTLKNVKGAWVKDQEITVNDGKVSGYKVILKVTFVLND
ncbi:MAG TPA: dodecin family protein [Eoetvoesiella sp.]